MTTSESESELSDCESIASTTSLSSDSSKCDSATEESTTRFGSRGGRYALIIGNNKYSHSSLKSCRKDARDMEKVLSTLDFNCTTIFDASKDQIKAAMQTLCQEINRNDCALIYFSGHGKAYKDDNYLIPIGRIRSTADDCISVNSLIKQLNNCSNKLNFIILDACRANKKNGAFKEKAFNGMCDEIFEKATRSSASRTTDSVKTPFALILSCDPGDVSYDGHSSHSNSRFTEVLLKHLAEPNLRHDDMMHLVTRELLDKKSKRKQRPWIHSCLHEPFYFNDGSRRFVRERTPTSQDLDQLKEKPRLKVTVDTDYSVMAANDKYLLYCSDNSLCVVDAGGHEILDVEREFDVYDMCWSSYKNRFLILYSKNQLYSLNIKTKEYKSVLVFDKKMYSCTCYEDTLLVSRFSSNTIEAYKMKNWKLIKKFKPSDLQNEDQDIRQIRYDSYGYYLGLLVTGRHSKYSFELRDADDMKLFNRIDLDCRCPCNIVSLPDQQFLISLSEKKKCILIDDVGELKETINYSIEVWSIAFIGNKKNCLVIQQKEPAKLRFYDLKD